MNEVIRAENISKLYRLGLISSRTIVNDFNRIFLKILGKGNPDLKIGGVNDISIKDGMQYVWALKDIEFNVNEGEVLAVIGKNGAGKSTLLKILSRVTSPTTGNIKIKGRVASLLEVGTGFHQELTGRENIFLNGSILGMTKIEIKNKFDEIVDFSGIGKYIDTPVKRYSSGMYVRLAFAVAAFLEPEILIVDEVLAVGDAEFQKKCLGKMHDVSAKEGRTVLFVSHNMAAVKNLCTRAVTLENGRKTFDGSVDEAVGMYLSLNSETKDTPLRNRADRVGGTKFRFVGIKLKNSSGENISQIISGESITIELEYECNEKLDGNVIFSVTLKDGFGNIKATFSTDEMGNKFENLELTGKVFLEIPKLMLRADNYSVRLFASLNSTLEENILDSIENASFINILPGDYWNSGKINRAGSYGLIDGNFYN